MRPAAGRRWSSTDVGRATWFTIAHTLAIVAITRCFSWRMLGVQFLLYVASGMGVTYSYHRQLAHRSFRSPKWLEYCAACAPLLPHFCHDRAVLASGVPCCATWHEACGVQGPPCLFWLLSLAQCPASLLNTSPHTITILTSRRLRYAGHPGIAHRLGLRPPLPPPPHRDAT